MPKDFRETLYTVDEKGRRRWVYSALVKGFYFYRRQIVAYLLLVFYLIMPWVSIGGKQGILLKITERRFVFFGVEFWATDGFLLFLFIGTLAFTLFFFTALLGRVWCGWACPETVFLEFLFRPIERLIEGSPAQRQRLDEAPWSAQKILKKILKHASCAFFSWIIASTALAYFIGREPLIAMMSDWPTANPVPFTMTLVLMGFMAFQFGWFREQFCTVLCPYARFQSVLMDSNSIVVGYDLVRGEPRSKAPSKKDDQKSGDCVDCGLCVRVCPTGIDIRNGLQLECIACTACVDACDSIMVKVGREKGLIRYDTENRLLGKSTIRQILRPRPFVYGVILIAFISALSFRLSTRELTEFQLVRGAVDAPFSVLEDGRVTNHVHARISNRSKEINNYKFRLASSTEIELIVPLSPFPVGGGETKTCPLFLNFQRALLESGKKDVEIRIEGEDGYSSTQTIVLLGPDHD